MNAIRVLLFGRVKEVAAAGEIELPAAPGETAASVLESVIARYPELEPWRAYLRVAVNREYAPPGRTVSPGDEVAVIPPVSGG